MEIVNFRYASSDGKYLPTPWQSPPKCGHLQQVTEILISRKPFANFLDFSSIRPIDRTYPKTNWMLDDSQGFRNLGAIHMLSPFNLKIARRLQSPTTPLSTNAVCGFEPGEGIPRWNGFSVPRRRGKGITLSGYVVLGTIFRAAGPRREEERGTERELCPPCGLA
jgi:hypothetical protein